jgi:outer membrane protein
MRSLPVLVMVATLVAPGRAAAAEGRTIDVLEAVRIALGGNVGLHVAGNSLAASEVAVARSRTAFLPVLQASLSPSMQLGRQFDPIRSEYRGFLSGSLSLGIGLDLMIFDGLASVYALKGAKLGRKASKLTLTRAEQDVVYETVVAYVAVVMDEELVAVAEENVAAQEQMLGLVEARKEAGKALQADIYKQRAELESAKLELIKARSGRKVDVLALENVLGLEPGSIAKVEGIAMPDEWPEADEDVVAQALEGRPDVLAMKARIGEAEEQVDEARAGYIPRVSLFAHAGTSWSSSMSEHYGFGEQMFVNNPGATIGLSIVIPIFDGLVTRCQVQSAKVEVTGRTLELAQLGQQVELEVLQALENYEKARTQLEVAERQLEYASESRAGYEEIYVGGGCTLVDVSQARALELQASHDVVEARYGMLVGAVAIAYAAGDTDGMLGILSG